MSFLSILPMELESIKEEKDLNIPTKHKPLYYKSLNKLKLFSIKRIYSLCIDYERKASETMLIANYSKSKEERERLEPEIARLKGISDLIRDLFYIELATLYPVLWKAESFGIFENWEIGYTNERHNPFSGLFKHLMQEEVDDYDDE